MRRRWRVSIPIAIAVLLSFNADAAGIHRERRQLSIDDLIHQALSLVRPIFDTSQPIRDSGMIHQQDSPMAPAGVGTLDRVLGQPADSMIPDVPGLCRGNSRICQFISCSAQNFKNDPTLANLNLGVQVLGDPKLRAAISSNPEAITSTCQEQGLDESQCRIFTKGFQLIDKFITTVEKFPSPKTNASPPPPPPIPLGEPEEEFTEVSSRETPHEGSGAREILPLDDEPEPIVVAPNIPHRPKTHGSKTWSSKPEEDFGRDSAPVLGDVVSNLTPIPPFIFTPPTPPPAPPLAFPTLPTFPTMGTWPTLPPLFPGLFPPLKIAEIPKPPMIQFSTDQEKKLLHSPNHVLVIKRINKNTLLEESFEDYDYQDEEEIQDDKKKPHKRGKRADYYDELDARQAQRNLGLHRPGTPSPGQNTDDYYAIAQDDPKPSVAQQPTVRGRGGPSLKNCMQLLG